MVTLPKSFTATKIPGYFWCLDTFKLYSIKIGGELRLMVKPVPNHFNHFTDGYRVSHKGYPRWLKMDYLDTLELEDSEIKINVVNRRKK